MKTKDVKDGKLQQHIQGLAHVERQVKDYSFKLSRAWETIASRSTPAIAA